MSASGRTTSRGSSRPRCATRAPPSRNPGCCARFDVLSDDDNPTHVILVEVYRDEDASSMHKQTEHYAAWRDAVAPMMAAPRSAVRFAAVFPIEEERWLTPPTA
jgi:autoinducer 2-degrading protein